MKPKPKKMLNPKASAYEKKKQMNAIAQPFNGKEEEKNAEKIAEFEINQGNDDEEIEEFFDDNAEEFEDFDALEEGERNIELYEKYKGCECCHGMVFRCEKEVCKNLGACYCYMRDQAEADFEGNHNN